MAVDQHEMWERFGLDALEALGAIEESVLRLETARSDRDELNRLYRGLHTVKGNSGLMGLRHLEQLAHACEDLIGLFRDGGLPFDDQSIELTLTTIDTLRGLVNEAVGARRDVAEASISTALEAVRGRAKALGHGGPAVAAAPPAAEPTPPPDDAPAPAPVEPSDDPQFLEIFLGMARDGLRELSPLLAELLVGRTEARVARARELLEELELATERMGFAPLEQTLRQLRLDVDAQGRPEHLAQLELEVHAQVVAIETSYRGLTQSPQSFGVVELYQRACANAAFADLAALREALDQRALEHEAVRALFDRLVAACRYYGFERGVTLALEVEDRLARALEEGRAPSEAVLRRATAFVEALGAAIFAANAGEESPDVRVTEAADDPMKFAPEVERLPFSALLRPHLTRTALAALTHFSQTGAILEVHAALEEAAELQAPFSRWMSEGGLALVCSAVVERPGRAPLYVFLVGAEHDGAAPLAALTALDGGRGLLRAWRLQPGVKVPVPGEAPAAARVEAPAPVARVEARAPGGFTELPSEGEEPVDGAANRTEFLRIDARKVSLIMDLAGELALAGGAVTHHPEVVGRDFEGFTAASRKLELLIRELQNEVSALRLVPVEGVFQRMRRVVRDAGRRTQKQVELALVGEDTEIDKLMVDALHDPLVHLVRNAIDHGLETPEERRAAGKAETGRIVLEASHQGGEVLVQITDDGRGLDRERIVRRARERGLIEPGVEPSDQQAFELIFLPGFSTKERIDELSGRGVGMDVVKTTVEGLRGRVQVSSTPGRGTRLRMSVPLTLAFVEAMIVRERQRLFAVPVEKVFEVFQAQAAQLSRDVSSGQTLVRVRERLVPVLWLHRFYGEPALGPEAVEGRVLVVVQTSRGELAIPVDALLGNQQVMLKPLTGPLAKIRAAAGCGMLRTGEVALALDCERLGA